MGTFLNSLCGSCPGAFFLDRMQSAAIIPLNTAPNIVPTKNDFNGDIFDLGNKLLRFDVSVLVVLVLMAQLLVS